MGSPKEAQIDPVLLKKLKSNDREQLIASINIVRDTMPVKEA